MACFPDLSVPSVLAKTSKVIANEKTDVTLSCIVNGSPVPSVVWLKAGKKLGHCNNFYGSVVCTSTIPEYNCSNSKGSYSLLIKNLSRESHDGGYECIASNAAARAKTTILLSVYGE